MLILKYKIVALHENENSITVRYYSEETPEHTLVAERDNEGNPIRYRTEYNINLPVPAPTEEALHNLILRAAPAGWLWTKEKVARGEIDLSSLKSLVGVEFKKELEDHLFTKY